MTVDDDFPVSAEGGICVLRFRGEVLGRRECERLEDRLRELAERDDCRAIVVDLEGIQFLSSAALAAFVTIRGRLAAAGRSMRLCSASAAVADVFWVTQLNRLLPIDDDLASALSALGAAAPRSDDAGRGPSS